MSAETINGARIVLETLHRLGVTDMFGYPGGAVIPIYDEFIASLILNIISFVMNKVQHMQQTAMLAYLVVSAYALLPLVLVQRIL